MSRGWEANRLACSSPRLAAATPQHILKLTCCRAQYHPPPLPTPATAPSLRRTGNEDLDARQKTTDGFRSMRVNFGRRNGTTECLLAHPSNNRATRGTLGLPQDAVAEGHLPCRCYTVNCLQREPE